MANPKAERLPGEAPETPIPKCTGNPKECALCDMIALIYKGFPAEPDPGCETAQKNGGQA